MDFVEDFSKQGLGLGKIKAEPNPPHQNQGKTEAFDGNWAMPSDERWGEGKDSAA